MAPVFLLYSLVSLSPCLRFFPLLCILKPNSTCENGTNCFCWGPLWEESGWAWICRRDQFVISCTGGKWICRSQVSLTGSAVIFCSIWACHQKLGKMFCWKTFGWWQFLKKVSGWKFEGLCVFLCLVLIRALELGCPTYLTTHAFNNFVRIFRNLSCETQHVFLSMRTDRILFTHMLLPSLNSGADPRQGLTGEKPMSGAAFLWGQLSASLSRDLRQIFAVRPLVLIGAFLYGSASTCVLLEMTEDKTV